MRHNEFLTLMLNHTSHLVLIDLCNYQFDHVCFFQTFCYWWSWFISQFSYQRSWSFKVKIRHSWSPEENIKYKHPPLSIQIVCVWKSMKTVIGFYTKHERFKFLYVTKSFNKRNLINNAAYVYTIINSPQTPPAYSSLVGSKVTLSCQPPLYQNITDEALQNVVQCLDDGHWSLDNVTLTCAPCNQSKDGTGIAHSILEVNAGGKNIGDTAELSCAADFMLPGVSRTVQCGSDNGSPTWLGLENVTCLQIRWDNPVKGLSIRQWMKKKKSESFRLPSQ